MSKGNIETHVLHVLGHLSSANRRTTQGYRLLCVFTVFEMGCFSCFRPDKKKKLPKVICQDLNNLSKYLIGTENPTCELNMR